MKTFLCIMCACALVRGQGEGSPQEVGTEPLSILSTVPPVSSHQVGGLASCHTLCLSPRRKKWDMRGAFGETRVPTRECTAGTDGLLAAQKVPKHKISTLLAYAVPFLLLESSRYALLGNVRDMLVVHDQL